MIAVFLFLAARPALADSPLSWSGPVPIDPGFPVSSVSCPAATQCTAIGSQPRTGPTQVMTFNPSSPGTPTPVTINNGDYVKSLACPSVSLCVAVGFNAAGQGQELAFDPSSPGTPTPVTIDVAPSNVLLDSVACPSSSQCTAVDGGYGREITFNPTAPGNPTPLTIVSGGQLSGVACPSANQCTAVGSTMYGYLGQGVEVTFDPTAPGNPTPVVIDGGSANLNAVACPSVSRCAAVNGDEVTFDPTSPGTPTPITIGGGADVACPSASSCVTVGGGQAVAFDPTSPGTATPATVDAGNVLSSVSCVSSPLCVAVDTAGNAFVGAPPPPSPPTVTAVSPSAGPTAGGVSATITGSNFGPGATVSFGTAAASVTSVSATQITALVPADSAGTVDVTVTTPQGTSATSPADQYSYDLTPTVSGVTPNTGPAAGGNTVTINGSNFVPGATVEFGSTAATAVTLVSATQLTAVAPANAAGSVDVSVTTPGGSSVTSGTDLYTYYPVSTLQAQVSVHGSTQVTTPSFHTATPGELLVAFVSADGPAGAGKQHATVSGAGLTWTLVKRANSQSGDAEVWQATAPSVLSSATVTSTESASGYGQSLTVIAMQGVKGIGATAAASATTGAPSVSLTTTAPNSLVFAVGHDWSNAIARTLPSGWALLDEWLNTGAGDTFWSQYTNTPTGLTGSVVAVKDTAPTKDQWNLVAVELVNG